jgi:hypothetical protein
LAPLTAALAAITYPVLLIGLWGVMSLMLDREVIDYPDAGPLLGPAVAVAGSLSTAGVLWRARTTRRSIVLAPVATLLTLIAMVVVGGIGYLASGPRASSGVEVLAHLLLSPFLTGGAVVSGLLVLVVQLAQPFDRRGR